MASMFILVDSESTAGDVDPMPMALFNPLLVLIVRATARLRRICVWGRGTDVDAAACRDSEDEVEDSACFLLQ